jgi:hypothetical protein
MAPEGAAAGYVRPWVAAAGGQVALHAHLPHPTSVEVVRIACANAEQHADGRPWGPEERIEPVGGGAPVTVGPMSQPLLPGTRVRARCDGLPDWRSLALVIALQRRPRGGAGAVLALASGDRVVLDIAVVLTDGDHARIALRDGRGATCASVALPCHDWLLLVIEPDAQGWTLREARCRADVPDGLPTRWGSCTRVDAESPSCRVDDLRLGRPDASVPTADVRVDLLSIVRRGAIEGLSPADLAACDPDGGHWEAASRADGCLLRARTGVGVTTIDLAGRATIEEPQRPCAGLCGLRWDGRVHDPALAPAHYTALQLHADTMLDAGWSPTLVWPVPRDLPSGIYAFRLVAQADAGSAEDDAPVFASFVVSAAGAPRARVAVWLPTFSWLAYSNATESMRGPRVSEAPHPAEARLDAIHPAHGRSLYERHADGQGVVWVGERRPLWSASPGHRPWQLVADTWLLDWLEREGTPFDVITDHDVHRDGAGALAPYAVVLTGHHPEYVSTPVWDALWSWLHRGGRLMYLGGNGFYWRTAVDVGAGLIEVRRAEDGTRPHVGAPGESHCAFTGEYGGLWRRLGRAPQRLVGVGMAAQGFDHGAPYRRWTDADAPEVAFVLAGVDGDTFGASGCWSGAASGWEIDRADAELGTPPGTWWLARSVGHAPSMLRTKEELLSYVPPFRDAKARSDIVVAPVGDGDVFAVGSMTWIGALRDPDGRNGDVATITGNVLRRFLDPEPIPRRTPDDR